MRLLIKLYIVYLNFIIFANKNIRIFSFAGILNLIWFFLYGVLGIRRRRCQKTVRKSFESLWRGKVKCYVHCWGTFCRASGFKSPAHHPIHINFFWIFMYCFCPQGMFYSCTSPISNWNFKFPIFFSFV